MNSFRPKLLAISSGGGHWVQLLRLRPAFEGCDVIFSTVSRDYKCTVSSDKFNVVIDSNRSSNLAMVCCAVSVLILLVRERPDIIITTGAAPGYFAARIGKLLGSRVVWVDSVANAEEMSLSGRKARNFSDLWLTQWAHVSNSGGPDYLGSVL
jgi:hypothetical protein